MIPKYFVYLILVLFIIGKAVILSVFPDRLGGIWFVQNSLRLHGIIFGIPLIVLAVLTFYYDIRRSQEWERLTLLELSVWLTFGLWFGIVGTLNGLIHSNAKVYVFGDLFKALVIPLGMYVSIKYLRDVDPYNVLKFIALCLFITLLPNLVGIVREVIESGAFRRVGTRSEFLYIFFFASFLLERHGLKKIFWCFLAIFMFIGNVASLSRSAVVLTIFATMFLLLFVGIGYLHRSILSWIVASGVAVTIVVAVPGARNILSVFSEASIARALSTYQSESGAVDISTHGRILEATYALEEFKRESGDVVTLVSHSLLGLGGGATYEVPEDTTHPRLQRYVRYGGGRSHQIHVSFASFFFRYGLIGLVLFNLTLLYIMYKSFSLFRLAKKYKDKNGAIFTLTVLCFLFVEFVHSISIYHIVGYLPFGIIFGLLVLYSKRMRKIAVAE